MSKRNNSNITRVIDILTKQDKVQIPSINPNGFPVIRKERIESYLKNQKGKNCLY